MSFHFFLKGWRGKVFPHASTTCFFVCLHLPAVVVVNCPYLFPGFYTFFEIYQCAYSQIRPILKFLFSCCPPWTRTPLPVLCIAHSERRGLHLPHLQDSHPWGHNKDEHIHQSWSLFHPNNLHQPQKTDACLLALLRPLLHLLFLTKYLLYIPRVRMLSLLLLWSRKDQNALLSPLVISPLRSCTTLKRWLGNFSTTKTLVTINKSLKSLTVSMTIGLLIGLRRIMINSSTWPFPFSWQKSTVSTFNPCGRKWHARNSSDYLRTQVPSGNLLCWCKDELIVEENCLPQRSSCSLWTLICLGCNKDLWSRRSKYKSYGALRGCDLGVRDCLQVYCGK